MILSNYIGLKEKDIISIVGAGGKTSLMFQLAKENKQKQKKILLTTTTKIYVPKKDQFDYRCFHEKDFIPYAENNKKGIYVYGTNVNKQNKVIGLNNEQLDQVIKYFDYIMIEADGANEKRLKGWEEFEPVVYGGTTKTIGVLDIQTIQMKICESNVFRCELFCNITGAKRDTAITIEHLKNMISHPKGLFKNATGEKILFIKKVEDIYSIGKAKALIESINRSDLVQIDKIIYGSIKDQRYHVM